MTTYAQKLQSRIDRAQVSSNLAWGWAFVHYTNWTNAQDNAVAAEKDGKRLRKLLAAYKRRKREAAR